MRNQMGNNNVSGLQEEEKSSAVEAQEKITQEAVHEGDVKVEADEKVEELSPDDQRSGADDSHGQDETSDGKGTANDNTEEAGTKDLVAQVTEIKDTEEEQKEDLVVQTTDTKSEPLLQPLEVPTESSGEATPVDESQTAPSSKLSNDSEKLLELNLEKHALVASDPKIPEQLSVGRETEEVEGSNSVSNANFTSSDVMDPKPDDRQEPVSSQDEPQREDLSVIERDGELLELNLSNHNQDNLHLVGDRIAERLDVNLISDTGNQEKEMKINDAVVEGNVSQEESFLETISIDEEKIEQLWVHGDEKGSITRGTEPVFSSDLRDNGEKRVDSSQEVSEPQDKSIVFPEEVKGTGKESENEEAIYDSIASPPEILKTSFDCERNAKENTSDSNSSPEMVNASQIEDDNVKNGASLVGNNEDYEKFEDVMENAPEVKTALTDLTVIEPNQKQENSTEGGLGRINIETNEETTRNQVDLRRSPSFDFDLSLGARYEDSDQTPLLCHDKAASRSISSRDVLTFQTTTSKNQYGRDQAVEVEEKTIRMERSDSDKPRAPFMNLLRKEGNANAFVELKKEEATLTEQAMANSTRGSGKRKPIASLFSTCICCATTIP